MLVNPKHKQTLTTNSSYEYCCVEKGFKILIYNELQDKIRHYISTRCIMAYHRFMKFIKCTEIFFILNAY